MRRSDSVCPAVSGAAAVQMKSAERKDAPALMLGGGAALFLAAIWYLASPQYSWILAAVGGALISSAAVLNGRRGEFHAVHHVVRLIVEILLIAGFMLA